MRKKQLLTKVFSFKHLPEIAEMVSDLKPIINEERGISAELKHKFQYVNTGLEKLHTDDYYKTISNFSNNNEIEQAIRNIIYLSSKYEQESYASELYSELVAKKPIFYYDVLYGCNAYLAYKSMKKSIDLVEKNINDENIKATLNAFKLNHETFVKKAKQSLNNFLHRLGKAISLYDPNDDEFFEI